MTEHRQTRRRADLSEEVDTLRPNAGRMYDYLLGGSANFQLDREAAEQCATAFPGIREGVWVNRAFLARVVSFLCSQGVDQFLDLGSGMPTTVGSVQEIARQHNPDAKVAYVDHEPVVVAHSRRLMASDPRISITRADIRQPSDVLSAPEIAGLLDFGRPLGILAIATLHFVPRSGTGNLLGAPDMIATYRDACAPGSYLAITHSAKVTLNDDEIESFLAPYERTPTPATFRSEAEIRELFDGYELIDPGLVLVPQWRPEQHPDERKSAETNLLGAVGHLSPS